MIKGRFSPENAAPSPARPPLKFWQRTWLAILALFLLCLVAVCGIAYTAARQQGYQAKLNEHLNRQHYFVQSLAQDMAALQARNPSALPALYAYYSRQYSGEKLYFEILAGNEVVYSSAPKSLQAGGERPELTAAPDTRVYLVRRTEGGRRLFAATGLPGTLEGTVVVCSLDMEDFYIQWETFARVLWLAGAGILAVFAAALWLVLRRLYQPLTQVTGTANALAGGELNARVPVTRRDEFGELALALNGMADTVQRQMTELQTLADQHQRLIENLSHEIRTPLAAIAGWTDTLRGASLTEDEQADALDTILFESNRVLSLSRRMLELSMLQREGTAEPFTSVDTAELLARTAAVAQMRAADRGVTFTVHGVPAFAAVQGDAVLLESLLLNLCDNAVKACSGMPDGKVELLTTVRQGRACFVVRDNGRGMSAEALRSLGQPFYREDKSRSRKEGGAGLGVALCMEVARRHGAALTYESAPGQGTTAVLAF